MAMRRPRTRGARRSGAYMAEFAVVSVVFFMLIFAIIEYSRLLMVLHVTSNAAREGARFAVVSTGDSAINEATIQNYVNTRLASVNGQLTGLHIDVFTVDPAGLIQDPPVIQEKAGSQWNDAAFTEHIGIRITGSFRPALPSFLVMPDSLPLNVTAIMNCEAN